MRISPNIIKLGLVLLVFGGIITITTLIAVNIDHIVENWLRKIFPGITAAGVRDFFIGLMIMLVMGSAIISFIKPLFMFLFTRADGIMGVYEDKSGAGLHIFTCSTSSGGEMQDGSRTIYHYFVSLPDGKLLLKSVYGHSMGLVAGRAGYEGFSSLETSVIGAGKLAKSLSVFSKKMGTRLALGKKCELQNEQLKLNWEGHIFSIKTFKSWYDEGFMLSLTTTTGQIRWRKKI
jgi:hypothetical protein